MNNSRTFAFSIYLFSVLVCCILGWIRGSQFIFVCWWKFQYLISFLLSFFLLFLDCVVIGYSWFCRVRLRFVPVFGVWCWYFISLLCQLQIVLGITTIHSATVQNYDGSECMLLTTVSWSSSYCSVPILTWWQSGHTALDLWFQYHSKPCSFVIFLLVSQK